MLDRDQLIQAFGQMIGWPYQSPGSNDKNGIDCSGAFVRGYKMQSAAIYHGSNRIIRMYCHGQAMVFSWNQVKLAAVVFKARSDISKMSGIYKPGGAYYSAALPYDYYHIGLITSLEPLTVIHATTPKARQDIICTRKTGETDESYQNRAVTALTKAGWSWSGLLDAIPYDGTLVVSVKAAEPVSGPNATVYASNGKPVKMRAEPSITCRLWWQIPVGTAVVLTGDNSTDWTGIKYNGRYGYMQSKFLTGVDNG